MHGRKQRWYSGCILESEFWRNCSLRVSRDGTVQTRKFIGLVGNRRSHEHFTLMRFPWIYALEERPHLVSTLWQRKGVRDARGIGGDPFQAQRCVFVCAVYVFTVPTTREICTM